MFFFVPTQCSTIICKYVSQTAVFFPCLIKALQPPPSDVREKDDHLLNQQQQQQDWSILWSCFENPISLLHFQNGLPKGMQEMVFNAVAEMRRYYSRKVIDVLIKVTRQTLDNMRRKFLAEAGNLENIHPFMKKETI